MLNWMEDYQMTMSKHEIAWARTGAMYGAGRVIEYRVEGPSTDEEVFIANFGNHFLDDWKILRVRGGVSGEWDGSYACADEAFASLRSLRTTPFESKACPKCSDSAQGTMVYSVPAAPTLEPFYTYHNCMRCGESVHRVIGGAEHPVVEPVVSPTERRSVLDASRAAQRI